MYSVAILAISSFLLALLIAPVVRDLCRRRRWFDFPDGDRKVHGTPTPRMGGVAIVAAYSGAFATLLATPLNASAIVKEALPLIAELLPAAGLVFAVGLLDDLRGVKPWQKLATQAAAGLLVYRAGISISSVGGHELPWSLSLPLTLLWLIGCSNAFNLIDGVDGLAAGAGLLACVTILIGALVHQNIPLAMATVPLGGALLGFLRYNFNPASIFLGDSGSLTIGFLLGCYGIVWGQKSATLLGMTAPLLALAVPVIDTALSIIRRIARGRPIFSADTAHIHHRLLARGLTPRAVALLIYVACGTAALLSLLASVSEGHFKVVVIILFCTMAWLAVRRLDYVEFGALGRVFVTGAFRRLLADEITLHIFEESVRVAETPVARWIAIRDAAADFGYDGVQVRLDGERFCYTKRSGKVNHHPSWTVLIPLSESDYVNLERDANSEVSLDGVGAFADGIQRALVENSLETRTSISLTALKDAVAEAQDYQPMRPAKQAY